MSVVALAAASADNVNSVPLLNRITSPLLNAAPSESTVSEVAPLEYPDEELICADLAVAAALAVRLSAEEMLKAPAL